MSETNPLAPGLHRGSGDLVRSTDWNSLVDGIDALSLATGQDLQEVRDQLATLVLGPATVHAAPGDDLAAKVAAIPTTGGQLALAAGTYDLAAPLVISQRQRLTIIGAGPATVLRCATAESALVLDRCADVQISDVRIEGGTASTFAGVRHLNGALELLGSTDVTVRDCVLACPGGGPKTRSALTATPAATPGDGVPFDLTVFGCRFEVGPQQIGLLVIDPNLVVIRDNRIRLAGTTGPTSYVAQGIVVAGTRIGTVRVLDNVVEDAVQGIHIGASRHRPPTPPRPVRPPSVAQPPLPFPPRPIPVGPLIPIGPAIPIGPILPIHLRARPPEPAVTSAAPRAGLQAAQATPVVLAGSVLVRGNTIRLFVPPAYARERHAVFIGNALSVQVLSTVASLRRGDTTGVTPTPVEGIRLYGEYGPFLVVRETSLDGFAVGVRVAPMTIPSTATWLVAETFADGAASAVVAPDAIARERNAPETTTPQAGPPVSVTLSPAVSVATANPQQITATVKDAAGLPVPGVVVRYTVSGATTVAEQAAPATDASGQSTLSYNAAVDTLGADTIGAYVDVDGNGQRTPGDPFGSASRVHAPTLTRLTLAPATANVTQGTPLTLTVTAFGAGGSPLAGVSVRFTTTGGQAPGPGQTGADGKFAGTAVFNQVGQFTVTAIGTTDAAGGPGGGSLQAVATVLVVAPAPPRITLSPGSLTVTSGNQACLTATVTDAAGRPVPGQPVRFAVTGANQGTGDVVTTAAGTAQFCYTAGRIGSDRVQATYLGTGADPNNRPFAVSSVTVIQPVPDRVPVPDVIDMSLSQATQAIQNARLVRGTVTTTGPAGGFATVQSQSPAAGALVVVGSAVNLHLVRERPDVENPHIPGHQIP